MCKCAGECTERQRGERRADERGQRWVEAHELWVLEQRVQVCCLLIGFRLWMCLCKCTIAVASIYLKYL